MKIIAKIKDKCEMAFAHWLFTPQLVMRQVSRIARHALLVIYGILGLGFAWGYIMLLWAIFIVLGGK